jgi:hypothetical protein
MAPNTPQKSNTVRNVVLGCAVVLLLAVVAGGFLFYQFVWKPGREMIASGTEAFGTFEELGRLEEGVEDRSPYSPPADGRLTAAQVERFIAVHRTVRGDLGPRWQEVEDRYEDTDGADPGGADAEPSFTELLGFWRDLGGIATDAKRRQVEALNEQGFSLGEYEWVREQAYLALGMETLAVGLDDVVAAAREGGVAGMEDLARQQERADDAVPPENRALVEPHREELAEWAPLALLGL